MRVLIVGAGVVGACVAAALESRDDVEVVVVDGRDRRNTASLTSLGWANANDKLEPDYHDLSRAAMAEYLTSADPRVRAAFRPSGNLELAEDAAHAEALEVRLQKLEALGYPLTRVSGSAVADLEPALLPLAPATVAAFFPDEGFVDVGQLITQALAPVHVLRAHGVYEVIVEGGRARGAALADGTRIDADLVVITAGAVSGRLLGRMGFTVDTVGQRGVQGVTQAGASSLSRIAHFSDFSLRPDGNGRVMLRSKGLDGLVPQQAEAGLRDLADRLATVLTDWPDGVRIESVRYGVRPVPPDGRPMIGWVPGVEGAYTIVTHSGVTLGALLGRLAAAELTGHPQERLARYRPERFVPG